MHNHLDADYRPLWDPAKPALRPKHPNRLRAFLYACAAVAADMDEGARLLHKSLGG